MKKIVEKIIVAFIVLVSVLMFIPTMIRLIWERK